MSLKIAILAVFFAFSSGLIPIKRGKLRRKRKAKPPKVLAWHASATPCGKCGGNFGRFSGKFLKILGVMCRFFIFDWGGLLLAV